MFEDGFIVFGEDFFVYSYRWVLVCGVYVYFGFYGVVVR